MRRCSLATLCPVRVLRQAVVFCSPTRGTFTGPPLSVRNVLQDDLYWAQLWTVKICDLSARHVLDVARADSVLA